MFRRLLENLFPRLKKEARPLNLVEADPEAFDRHLLKLFYTRMNSDEARECFRVQEAPRRPRAQLHRVV